MRRHVLGAEHSGELAFGRRLWRRHVGSSGEDVRRALRRLHRRWAQRRFKHARELAPLIALRGGGLRRRGGRRRVEHAGELALGLRRGRGWWSRRLQVLPMVDRRGGRRRDRSRRRARLKHTSELAGIVRGLCRGSRSGQRCGRSRRCAGLEHASELPGILCGLRHGWGSGSRRRRRRDRRSGRRTRLEHPRELAGIRRGLRRG